jgi:hypothetical protein
LGEGGPARELCGTVLGEAPSRLGRPPNPFVARVEA